MLERETSLLLGTTRRNGQRNHVDAGSQTLVGQYHLLVFRRGDHLRH